MNLSIDLSILKKYRIDHKSLILTKWKDLVKNRKDFSGFTQIQVNNMIVNIYDSGRVLFQGDIKVVVLEELLKRLRIEDRLKLQFPIIGTDEAGKGERKGELVTGGILIKDWNAIYKLLSIGVSDSKRLTDFRILQISDAIKQLQKQGILEYKILYITPQKFNELWHKFSNINRLLGWTHATIIKELSKNIDVDTVVHVYVDRFSKIDDRLFSYFPSDMQSKMHFIIEPKGEIYPWVAAAAIMAKSQYNKNKDKYLVTKDYK